MAPETLTNFTYDDLLEMPDDGRRYEILDGELIVNASPIPRHQIITFNVATMLRSYVKPRQLGTVFISPLDVVFSQEWVVEPDVIYIRRERLSIMTRTNVSGAPDLTVEVLSESTRKRDEIKKRHAYEDFGVAEYWIVDPELESMKVYRRNERGRYDRVVEVSMESEGAFFTSPLFPGLEISLAEVFAE
jgi:Uma2 family endonuclease